MIERLIANCKDLEAEWDLEKFPERATEYLARVDFLNNLEEFESEAARWMLQSKELPKQLNLYNSFGEPPVTFFNNGKFAIDVYFWRKNDTLIHSHAFRGAFKVLFGTSLHEEFEIRTEKQIDVDLIESKITSSNIKIMKSGDTQTILPGMRLVHRVVHLDNPTITLCLRTVDDVELKQWHHLSSGLSYQKHNLSELTIKRVLYLQYLLEANQAKATEFLDSTLEQMSASEQLSLYEAVFFNEFGLEYEPSCYILDTIRERCSRGEWFQRYEGHFSNLEGYLREHSASTAPLKLLAHSINCKYSVSDCKRLLAEIDDASCEDLLQLLLDEEAIFVEEHLDVQRSKIKEFV